MRGMFLWAAGLFGIVPACSEETSGRLTQVAEEPRLFALPDGALVSIDAEEGDSSADTREGDLIENDSADTAGGADLDDSGDGTTPTDTGNADTNPDSTDITTDAVTDTGPTECQEDGDCRAAPCNTARCEEGTCREVPADGGACSDNDPCTLNDRCTAGQCRGNGQLACNDGDPCTVDACTAGVGCTITPTRCDDSSLCTTDACVPGVGCQFAPIACPEVTIACLGSTCDPLVGCTVKASDNGTTCDDGNPCTLGDACKSGLCEGTPNACDDGNSCTLDSCIPGGGCLSLPIPGCAADPQCANKQAGSSCDDGNASTSADMCILGECAGFALTRITGTTVADQEGLVLLETEFFSEQWWAIFWTLDNSLDTSFAIAKVTTPGAPTIVENTLQADAFAGLHDGFAGDFGGRLWRYSNDAWSPDNGWDAAMKESERGSFTNLFTARDLDASGNSGVRHLWGIGESDGLEWIRYCVDGNTTVSCEVQELDDFEDASIPQAIAGTPVCDSTGRCGGFELVLGADAWAGGSYYNDTYENLDGTDLLWSQGRVPESAANRTTEAAVGWGEGATSQYLVVGTNGYIVHRRTSGDWSNPLSLKDGQSNRDFYGAWEGAGVVVLGCTRPVSGGQLAYELWVAPSDSNVETGSSWTIHELLRAPSVNAAGLYDVHGRPSGEIRAVGAVRRSSGVANWLDGAVWVRTP